ncbi:3-keto-5-aminohexanoate cleavage protein [Pseudenhygromyxa sp. WMMC2535]|uniref:3-keto-5-aminohexanoate cleavage protein n=1 Tax=Pseudenhygromyxa sp. WMMC2535 TaxID=2712867 RepID=UPI001552BDD5|nr:3-keto-5-aminohexanoate cleavage protein [Pseudenhygromyxa sp. WMMC2535]NVB36960.1 3-keto-5-aminohexanoate cleavage protein [Pseudenhygromyxa sp. WMMC2535]
MSNLRDKAALTCAITGVLTNPKQHPVPVTVAEMAQSARQAFDAGAAIMHVHFRSQAPGMGHMPSWEPEIAGEIIEAIRQACPGVIINMSTGVVGADISGPEACMRRVRPEIAACNAGSLNYLKVRSNGQWAWPPMLFDNPVAKVEKFLKVMAETGAMPEFECFDVGIVRSIELFVKAGLTDHPDYNFVMGVASGMPADPRLLELLVDYRLDGSTWQVTAIGREEVWALHRRTAELGGQLRTGVEDTFYLPSGDKSSGNGPLIEALATCAREAGREVASPEEARQIYGLRPSA